MSERVNDWTSIARNPRFVELQRRKTAFLVTLWGFGTLSYFLLPLGVALAPSIFKAKVVGRLNFAYFFCLYQFVMGWGIAVYYAYRCGRDFDPLAKQLLDDIDKGGAR